MLAFRLESTYGQKTNQQVHKLPRQSPLFGMNYIMRVIDSRGHLLLRIYENSILWSFPLLYVLELARCNRLTASKYWDTFPLSGEPASSKGPGQTPAIFSLQGGISKNSIFVGKGTEPI